MLAANTADRIRSDLADFPSRCAAGWNGSQSRSGPAGCSTQRTFLEFFVYPAIVYVAHRKDRRCADVCDLLHHSDHGRQSDCAVESAEHLAAQVQLAQESERLRKTLLDCVSHELKTPLAAIGAASQELSRLTANIQDSQILKELAGEIRDGSHRLNRVVNNLLDMNRLESGVIRPKREWCDVRELLQSAVDTERESINGRDIRLDVPEEIPLALVDHTLIEQAVAKLLANAGSHTPPNLPIEIDAEYTNEDLLISVSDRGPGIPPEATERLFEKFYRGDDRKTGGLGLGLSIARGLIEAHGGRLTAENRDGGGARFVIRLPVRVTNMNAIGNNLMKSSSQRADHR